MTDIPYVLDESEQQKWDSVLNAQPPDAKKFHWTEDAKEMFFKLIRKFHVVIEKGGKCKNFDRLAEALQIKGKGSDKDHVKGSYLSRQYRRLAEEMTNKMKKKDNNFDPTTFNPTVHHDLHPWIVECINAVAEEKAYMKDTPTKSQLKDHHRQELVTAESQVMNGPAGGEEVFAAAAAATASHHENDDAVPSHSNHHANTTAGVSRGSSSASVHPTTSFAARPTPSGSSVQAATKKLKTYHVPQTSGSSSSSILHDPTVSSLNNVFTCFCAKPIQTDSFNFATF